MKYLNCKGFINNRDLRKMMAKETNSLVLYLSESHITQNSYNIKLKIDEYKYEKFRSLIHEELDVKMERSECFIATLYQSPQKSDNLFLDFLCGVSEQYRCHWNCYS